MSAKLMGWEDTIVALATPPGIGAIGIIRVSGKNCMQIVAPLFPSKDIHLQPSHTLLVGLLRDGDILLDEAVISLFRAPRSYTGEDVIEISCHGSPYILQQVVDTLCRRGARLARPGEFTQRAFLNGKFDLTQAEAVADLIASETGAAQKAALHTVRGGFSVILKQLREQLISFSALIELELDFSQEDVEFADRRQLNQLLDEAEKTTSSLIDSFQFGNVVRKGVLVAIVGKPNSGKSTLLNTLLNENRAIVSEIAGTTRDTIEEVLNIDGILFRLADTAGIREHSNDQIERIGIERSLEKMEQADLIIYLFDVRDSVEEVTALMHQLKMQKRKFLLTANKIDLLGEHNSREKFASVEGVLFLSAKAGLHTSVLKERMVNSVLQGKTAVGDTLVTNARHYHSLLQVHTSLIDIRKAIAEKRPGDLVAIDIRRCLYYLGEITGEITNKDQLDYIFSKFCIGK